MTAYLDMATDDLRALEQELAAQYDVAKAKGIKLNMARGKPAPAQLDLSLPLLEEDRGLARTFPEIAEREPSCRFRDCTHGNEPGCAVRAGLEEGAVDAWRLEEYRSLAAEMLKNRRGLDPSAKASITQ